jgi:hypothetical protein
MGMEWIMLSLPSTPVNVQLGLACRGHFVGDPATDSETDIAPDNLDELAEGDDWVHIHIFFSDLKR